MYSETKYVIKTNSYAGSFDRELMAYCTGESQYGDPFGKLVSEELDEKYIDFFCKNILKKAYHDDDEEEKVFKKKYEVTNSDGFISCRKPSSIEYYTIEDYEKEKDSILEIYKKQVSYHLDEYIKRENSIIEHYKEITIENAKKIYKFKPISNEKEEILYKDFIDRKIADCERHIEEYNREIKELYSTIEQDILKNPYTSIIFTTAKEIPTEFLTIFKERVKTFFESAFKEHTKPETIDLKKNIKLISIKKSIETWTEI